MPSTNLLGVSQSSDIPTISLQVPWLFWLAIRSPIDLFNYSFWKASTDPIGCKWGRTHYSTQPVRPPNLGYPWPVASTLRLDDLCYAAASRHVEVWLQSGTIVGHRSVTPFSAAHDHVHIHLRPGFLPASCLSSCIIIRHVETHPWKTNKKDVQNIGVS